MECGVPNQEDHQTETKSKDKPFGELRPHRSSVVGRSQVTCGRIKPDAFILQGDSSYLEKKGIC